MRSDQGRTPQTRQHSAPATSIWCFPAQMQKCRWSSTLHPYSQYPAPNTSFGFAPASGLRARIAARPSFHNPAPYLLGKATLFGQWSLPVRRGSRSCLRCRKTPAPFPESAQAVRRPAPVRVPYSVPRRDDGLARQRSGWESASRRFVPRADAARGLSHGGGRGCCRRCAHTTALPPWG